MKSDSSRRPNSVKFNRKYAEVVREILNALFAEAPHHECDVTILTSYTAQRALYVPIIGALHIMTGISIS